MKIVRQFINHHDSLGDWNLKWNHVDHPFEWKQIPKIQANKICLCCSIFEVCPAVDTKGIEPGWTLQSVINYTHTDTHTHTNRYTEKGVYVCKVRLEFKAQLANVIFLNSFTVNYEKSKLKYNRLTKRYSTLDFRLYLLVAFPLHIRFHILQGIRALKAYTSICRNKNKFY